jgi:hypothetical protein
VGRDVAYPGQTEVIHQCAPRARNCTQRRCLYKGWVDEVEWAKNRTKSRVRSKVDEAEVWVREGALPRIEEERPPAVCHLRSGELV